MTDVTDPNELGNVLNRLQAQIDELKLRPVSFDGASEAMNSISDIQQRIADENGVVRYIASPTDIFDEFGIHANWALFDANGSPMIWGDTETGVVRAAQFSFSGTAQLDALVILNQIGDILQQTATVGSETRQLRIGLQDNGTYPEAVISFAEPSGTSVTVPNGDFATGDMTDWTQDVAVWDAADGYAKTGFDHSDAGVDPQITSSRFPVTAGEIYTFSARSMATFGTLAAGAGSGWIYVDVTFFTALSGGSAVGNVVIADRRSAQTYSWITSSKNFVVPATATHASFRAFAFTESDNYVETVGFDDFTCQIVSAESKFIMRDDGLYYTDASKATSKLGGIQFAPTTVSVGLSQNRVTGSSYTYAEQRVTILRPMKLDAVLWDLYTTGDYTLTIRDHGGNVLQTIANGYLGIPGAGIVFDTGDKIYMSGRYRLRMTRNTGAAQWYDRTSGDQLFTQLDIVDGISYGGTLSTAYRSPLKLRFYEAIG